MTFDETARKEGEQAKRPMDDPYAKPDDTGAYIGSQREGAAEAIPGGVDPHDARVAAHSTQLDPVRDDSDAPADRREAGQSR